MKNQCVILSQCAELAKSGYLRSGERCGTGPQGVRASFGSGRTLENCRRDSTFGTSPGGDGALALGAFDEFVSFPACRASAEGSRRASGS